MKRLQKTTESDGPMPAGRSIDGSLRVDEGCLDWAEGVSRQHSVDGDAARRITISVIGNGIENRTMESSKRWAVILRKICWLLKGSKGKAWHFLESLSLTLIISTNSRENLHYQSSSKHHQGSPCAARMSTSQILQTFQHAPIETPPPTSNILAVANIIPISVGKKLLIFE